MTFELLGFDSDNGSEFLNTVLEEYLLTRERAIKWTRSRPYKKNDQAHVEQKNCTDVRQLLGYGRYDEIELKALVDDHYQTAWLPLCNHFTPVMKLVEKTREGSKVKKRELRMNHQELGPINLAQKAEKKLGTIFQRVDRIEQERKVARFPKNEPSVMRFPGASRVYDSHEKKKTYLRTNRQKASRR